VKTTADAWTSRSRLGKRLTRSAIGVAAFALASSVLATPGASGRSGDKLPEPDAGPVQVVVVTLDGARYQEIFAGVDPQLARERGVPASGLQDAAHLMPNLRRLMSSEGAALGSPGRGPGISASGPQFVSLPGYSEIFTGRRVTGCLSNDCQGTTLRSIADEMAELTPGARKVAIITSWPDIARVGAKSERVSVSTGRHAGATRAHFEQAGAVGRALKEAEAEPPWPGNGDFRRDRRTAALALAYLRAEQPDFLFVGLGETDEFAHQGNYAGYLDALREADRFLGDLAAELEARARTGVRTALFITADHGRAATFKDHGQAYPESARVWLVASGRAIEPRGLLESNAGHHLADIAPTVRALFGLPADRDRNAGFPLTELVAPLHP
jgi:Type I phosphodiesterase / nucleotide pyrophosphatase